MALWLTLLPVRRKAALAAAGLGLIGGLTGCGSQPSADPSIPSASTGARASAPVSAYPVTVSDCGREVTVEAAPTRAITMNQGATEVLLALGLQDSMVGTAYLDDSVAPRWAPGYESVPVLSKEYPNQEAVLASKPDFVYGSYSSAFDEEAAGSMEGLQALGIASYVSPFGCEDKMLRPEVSFEAVWREIDDIAAIFGVPDRAAALVTRQQAEVAATGASQPGADVDVFWFDSGDRTPYAGTGGGAPELILDSVAARNIFSDIPGGWAEVSWEKVVAADPDVIVLVDAAWSTADEKKKFLTTDPALKDLTAVKNKQYVVLPFSETTAGVRTADAVVALADQLAALGR